ncbi:LpqB family beta-propeller domain-containing protein [Paractinoplanes atraurantiacus]|uniref:Lipoprotein LpqB beta-propeller domain-containing protein n=1 Tax=Paractinoplanes atraurantiacus TaxID=1036182 RepID=A0A285GYU0_9ACTN|nr:LpqB family beta-propeller domain-containing protein [Actinoplanes atraurantiacus]SNY28682.1 Lipoprotein LpqB beta-propeller domain-containing protein [Actinoplanes atraurantiacus]
MRRLLVGVVALAVLVPGGCGIPDRSEVTVIGDGRSAGVSVEDEAPPPIQYKREAATNPRELVQYYLQAAAGDPQTALERVKAFLAPEEAADFTNTDVRVVREAESILGGYSPTDSVVTITEQQVGNLTSNGELVPAAPTPDSTYKIKVGTVEGRSGLWILDAPQVMLLTADALSAFYQRRAIYFWNKDNTSLVPDLRYMPRSVPAVQQPTKILQWLAAGPSDWLRDSVQALPQGTDVADNIPAVTDETLQINLTAQTIPAGSDAGAMDRLRRQVQWSIYPVVPRTLEIKIGRQDPVSFKDGEYRESNLAYFLDDSPERFVVFGGAVRRLKETPRAEEPVPVLKEAANKGITTAALSSSTTHEFAAVVTGSGSGQRLRVAAAPIGQQADLKEVKLQGALGQPVWAQTGGTGAAGAVGLITAGGHLYSFGADGGVAQRVEWQGDPGTVTAISVAPDGRRVALVSGGRLYRTVLNSSADGVAMSGPQQVLPPNLKSVTAVAWSSQSYLAVAGVRADNNRVSVIDVTVDGALSATRLADIGAEPVSYLTAYPENPITGTETSDSEAYVAGGEAWDVFSQPNPITKANLAGPAVNAPATVKPTAPLYLN